MLSLGCKRPVASCRADGTESGPQTNIFFGYNNPEASGRTSGLGHWTFSRELGMSLHGKGESLGISNEEAAEIDRIVVSEGAGRAMVKCPVGTGQKFVLVLFSTY